MAGPERPAAPRGNQAADCNADLGADPVADPSSDPGANHRSEVQNEAQDEVRNEVQSELTRSLGGYSTSRSMSSRSFSICSRSRAWKRPSLRTLAM